MLLIKVHSHILSLTPNKNVLSSAVAIFGITVYLASSPGDPPRALAAWFKGSNNPAVLEPAAVPGKPAPRIPVMGRLTPSAMPVTGRAPAVVLRAVPIRAAVVGARPPGAAVPVGLPLEVPGGLLPWLLLTAI